MTKLNLYVWEGILTDYTDGIAFAVAKSVEEARELIIADDEMTKNYLNDEPIIITGKYGKSIWGGG